MTTQSLIKLSELYVRVLLLTVRDGENSGSDSQQVALI